MIYDLRIMIFIRLNYALRFMVFNSTISNYNSAITI